MQQILRAVRDYLLQLQRKHALILMSIGVGIASGLVAVILKNAVYGMRFLLTERFASDNLNWLYVFYPVIGILITLWIVKRVLRDKHPGPGIPSTLFAISKRNGQLRRKQIYAPIITSIFTVGFGGSAGLEAPAVQASASIGSNLAASLKMSYKVRILMIGCAAAGSLAAIFKAPVAAIVFAVEVIMIDLTTASLVPLLMASLSALLTTYLFLDDGQLLVYEESLPFQWKHIGYYLLLGVGAGFFSVYFNKIYLGLTGYLQSFKRGSFRLVASSVLLGLILLFFPALYGEGYDILNAYLRNDLKEVTLNSIFYDLPADSWLLIGLLFAVMVLKVVATSLTLGSGGVGGIFAPTLFMGGTFGFVSGKFLEKALGSSSIPVGSFTLLGMAGLMAGVLHAPLTSIFMIAEISGGYDLFVPLMLTAGIAYYTSKLFSKHTIYTRELAARGELITHDKDKAVLTLMSLKEEIETDFVPVQAHFKLRQMVQVISRSRRNLFPVLSNDNQLIGVVSLDDVRPIMFNHEVYDEIEVEGMMTLPPEIIQLNDSMEVVVKKFDESGAWNLPVVDANSRYMGFVSKSKLFSAYRKILMEVS